MSRLNLSKINHLMQESPEGGVLTTTWLEENGYYKQLVKRYCDSGWLVRLGKGAYSRLNDRVTWVGAVKALQEQLELNVHVGGLTALALCGVTQYVYLGDEADRPFYLYNTLADKVHLPAWFVDHFKQAHYCQKNLFDQRDGTWARAVSGFDLNISVPERAILEVLALVPDKITLQHASELMENLNRLRVDVLQRLLESCHSIKAKRLFLCLSEMHHLDFFKELSIKKIALGSGKRVIGEGGKYYPKWQLSLPDDLGNDLGEIGA